MHVSNLLVFNGLDIYKILKSIEIFEQSFQRPNQMGCQPKLFSLVCMKIKVY